MRQGRMRSGVLLVAVLLAGLGAPLGSSAQLGRVQPVDVSAIVLTASDLEDAGLEGLGVWAASPFDLPISVDVLSSTQALDADEVEAVLEDAGFTGSYVHNYHQPADADDPGGIPLLGLTTRAYGFEDANGAEDAFDVIGDESELGFDDEPGRLRLGDDAELTMMAFDEDSTYGVPYEHLELEILFDQVVLEVSLYHFELDGEIERFRDDDTDLAVTLGERLIERAEAAINGETPGLQEMVVRLDAEYTLAPYMTYYLLDGEGIESIWESEDEFADRVEADAATGAISILRREQLLTPATDTQGSLVYYNLTYQFDRERDAEDFVDGVIENVIGEEIEDVPDLGDQSFGYLQDMETDGKPWQRSQLILRVGDVVTWIWFEQIGAGADNPEISAESVIEIGEAQADCLDRGGCRGATEIPDDLQEIIDDLQ